MRYFCSALALTLLAPSPARATLWQDLWYTPDQQGQNALQKGDAASAQLLFKDPEWQASAAYKNNDFESAIEFFKQGNSADNYYNLGNAMAKMGELDKAIDAYTKALDIELIWKMPLLIASLLSNQNNSNKISPRVAINNRIVTQKSQSQSQENQQENASEQQQEQQSQQQSEQQQAQQDSAEQQSSEADGSRSRLDKKQQKTRILINN